MGGGGGVAAQRGQGQKGLGQQRRLGDEMEGMTQIQHCWRCWRCWNCVKAAEETPRRMRGQAARPRLISGGVWGDEGEGVGSVKDKGVRGLRPSASHRGPTFRAAFPSGPEHSAIPAFHAPRPPSGSRSFSLLDNGARLSPFVHTHPPVPLAFTRTLSVRVLVAVWRGEE